MGACNFTELSQYLSPPKNSCESWLTVSGAASEERVWKDFFLTKRDVVLGPCQQLEACGQAVIDGAEVLHQPRRIVLL